MGHAEISTTQIYAQVAIRQLQKVHASTHPGAMRRRKSAPNAVDDIAPQVDAGDTAEDLLAALDAEGEDEDKDL
jgi:integrase/recombinase XerD